MPYLPQPTVRGRIVLRCSRTKGKEVRRALGEEELTQQDAATHKAKVGDDCTNSWLAPKPVRARGKDEAPIGL